MTTEVWGTFSVRDHLRPEAFLREVLIFDRLLVPYPDPKASGERKRWNSNRWGPHRLDVLLEILGAEDIDGHNGANSVQRVMWSPALWDAAKFRLNAANAATGDPFHDTRIAMALPRAPEVPNVVEAVAAYPSETTWRKDLKPVQKCPKDADIRASEALVVLPRPLLLPPADLKYEEALKRVVDLAQDPDFKRQRLAYFNWFRDFVEPLRSDGQTLEELKLDPPSLVVAQRKLRALWDEERKVVERGTRAKWFTRGEIASVTAGTAGTVGLAAIGALPVIGVATAVAAFVGWALGRAGKQQPPRSVAGATMFVNAQRRLDWLDPTAP